MPTAEEFDEFYVSTRRRLVLTTFALTGDLVATRSAVRDAYVAARHHWDKVGASEDPESWVRPRAWSAAQRRHTVRPWHRERHVTSEQAAVLEALHQLPDSQRRALVLSHLTDLPLDAIGRELSQPLSRLEVLFDEATRSVAEALACPPTEIAGHLDALGPAADTVKLPRPPIIRRNGLRRRRNFAVVGSVLLAATTVLAGSFVAVSVPAAGPPSAKALVGKKMLLTDAQVAALAPQHNWRTTSTGDNTAGDGINTPCQISRFADANGLGTWVRIFATPGKTRRDLVQTVEISNSDGAAKEAYGITLGWYAGCTAARLQLVDAFKVSGVGDQAQVLRLRIANRVDRSFVVGIARTGALTTSTVLTTRAGKPVSASLMAQTLATSVRNLCASRVARACVTQVRTTETRPPLSGEAVGMLATGDLPVIPTVTKPWSGTDPVPATVNPAATTCDNANFARSGARKPLTRSFLILQAKLPKRFGLTETIGSFSSPSTAAAFVKKIQSRMNACPDRELGSKVSQSITSTRVKGTSYSLWRLENQVNKNQEEAKFWMGVARVGSYVAQVYLTPVDQYDVDQEAFRSLVRRARDRLYEVSK
ncbi:MAG: hypothetical protein JWQ74_565 [Marmoricola sp.]|nr:hypothetical protein [Marmoricola sp.]